MYNYCEALAIMIVVEFTGKGTNHLTLVANVYITLIIITPGWFPAGRSKGPANLERNVKTVALPAET